MINLKTGKHFNSTATPLTEVTPRGTSLTRGGFLKGILASGIAPSLTIGAVSLAGSANASVGGMMRNVGARQAAMFGGGGWTNPYVTDGLIAMWDGEWNAGPGIHDANATVWTDIINGYVATNIGTRTLTWTDNSLNVSMYGVRFRSVVENQDLITAVSNAKFTLEIVFNFNHDYSGSNHNLSCVYLLNDCGLNYPQCNMTNAIINNAQGALAGVHLGATRLYSYVSSASLAANETVVDFYFDSSKKRTATGSYVKQVQSNEIYLGTASYDQSRFFPYGDYYCYRLYSRTLSDDEIAANYAVDKARFNLA